MGPLVRPAGAGIANHPRPEGRIATTCDRARAARQSSAIGLSKPVSVLFEYSLRMRGWRRGTPGGLIPPARRNTFREHLFTASAPRGPAVCHTWRSAFISLHEPGWD